jgi:hypothetical protein
LGIYTRLILSKKMIASSSIVPQPSPNEPVVAVIVTDAPLIPFTCPWAQDGLRKAMEGLQATSAGVKAYKVGTRNVEYHTVAEAQKAVDYWNEMVKLYCGVEMLPNALTGRDTAFRVVLRDV